jgi:hypothetical protein
MRGGKEFAGGAAMTCEEFAMAALDLDLSPDSAVRQAALEHMRRCAHCAVLQENWQALRADLHVLGHETRAAQAGPGVEMRLRQEFRAKHTTMKTRRTTAAATWALAAAAVLVLMLSWVHWRNGQAGEVAKDGTNPTKTVPQQLAGTSGSGVDTEENLVASNTSSDTDDFTLLPGAIPWATEDATVVHVEMQRAALDSLGLTVNEEHAGDWIQVDLLVGDDGLPQAVRLPQGTN